MSATVQQKTKGINNTKTLNIKHVTISEISNRTVL